MGNTLLYTTRMNDDTADAFFTASGQTKVEDAFSILGNFVGAPIKEIYMPTAIDKKGAVLSSLWKPFHSWDGKIWLNTNTKTPNLVKSDPIFKELQKRLMKGMKGEKIVISEDDGVTAEYVTLRSTSAYPIMDDPESYILIKKVA